jgi:hypothetical protein
MMERIKNKLDESMKNKKVTNGMRDGRKTEHLQECLAEYWLDLEALKS